MISKNSTDKLHHLVANALRKVEAVESAYESITLGKLVSMRARTHATTVAIDVFDRGQRATYAEMDLRSNEYANALRALGVRKGDRIGVMLPNRIEFPILWFAIAKLGAVMVPVNMRYTSREVEYVLSDTQAKFAVVDESVWPVFAAMKPWPKSIAKERVIVVGQALDEGTVTLEGLLKGINGSPVDEDVCAEDLLNIQYTSGTTGFPKGCMLTHEFWSEWSYQSTYWDRQPYQRYLSAQPFFYIDAQGHLLRSYRQGGTLYLGPQLSSTRFLGWLKQYQAEWCSFPEMVMRQPEVADDRSICLKQAARFGWADESIRLFRERFRIASQNGYGMTEIGWGALMPGDIDEIEVGASVGVRAPLRNLRLMNEDGMPTTVGEIGEMWVKGRGIFRGYWNRPEANAALFEGEWFKTGDLFQQDEAGFLWLVGRTKDMIRRSSENISAREVEDVIREVAEIADVAAVPVRDIKRGEEVKIFVELKAGVTPDNALVERILGHARTRLAVFKVPRYIAFIPELPRSIISTNKVLKRELMAITDQFAGTYDSEERRWQ